MEFVMTMPLLMMLVMLILQFALIVTARQFVAYAAFCAARSTLSANEKEGKIGARLAARQVLAWMTNLGPNEANDIEVPGWGKIPESNSIDRRLAVKATFVPKRYTSAKVAYRYPLLIPIAGRMIGWLTRHSWQESAYVKSRALPPGWLNGVEDVPLIDGMPYITLTETCVLPLPYSPANLPANAFDYGTWSWSNLWSLK